MAELMTPTKWDGDEGGLRVLVEAAEWHTRQAMARTLQDAGHRVAGCPGPSGADARCPLASGRGCPAAEEADVIVYALHPADHRNAECLRAHRTRHPATPVVVDLPEAMLGRRPADYAGCVLVQEPGSGESLLTAVVQAAT